MSGGRKKTTWRVIGAAVVVAVILLAVRWAFKEPAPAMSVSAPPARVGLQPTNALPRNLANAVVPHVPPKQRAAKVDECGITRIPSTATRDGESDADSEDDDLVISATPETRHRWEAALLDSSDSRARAIGLVIRRTESVRAGSIVQAEESRDELVQLAAGSSDPAVYAIAFGLCRMPFPGASTAGACQRISLSEWTRLDPDNAVPWILAAQAARTRNDTQAETDAFARAADTHRIDNYSDSLLSFGLTEVPRDITPAEKTSLAVELVGYEAAWGGPELSEISRFCAADALRRDETHKECNSVAELLVNHGSTLINFSFGTRIGERVGWPSERLQGLSQERDALIELGTDEEQGWSCEKVHRVNEFIEKRAQLGELAAIRELRDRRTAARDHTDAITTTAGSTTTSSQFSPDPPRSITRK
jgi:hypothetical protein